MKKIPNEIDNPIDNILIELADQICPFLYKTGHTPNVITTYSLITGFLSAYSLYQGNLWLFVVFYILSYFFDCVDGHFARKYDMITDFGDAYDHFKDIFVFLLIIYVVYVKCGKNVTFNVFLFLFVFLYMATWHFSCQEQNCDEKFKGKSDTYTPSFRFMCKNKENIRWTRFFGMGTFIFIFMMVVVYVCGKCKGKNKGCK
jgi:phosphatidylglycerophosphate synthase